MAFTEGQTLDNMLGSLFVGSLLAGVLYGVTSLQAYSYYHWFYGRDSLVHRIAVGLLWCLDTLHFVLVVHGVYYYCVSSFGSSVHLSVLVWSMKLQIVINVIIILLVQGLYAYRVWLLGGYHNKIIAYITVAIVSIAFGVGMVLAHYVYTLTDIADHESIGWAIIASLATATFVDFFIAGAMVYYLRRSRGLQSRVNSKLSTMMHMSLTSGVLTSACSMTALIVYVTMPKTLIFMGVESFLTKRQSPPPAFSLPGSAHSPLLPFAHPPVYINSFLAMLNARERQQHTLTHAHVHHSDPAQHADASHSHPHSHSRLSTSLSVHIPGFSVPFKSPAPTFPSSPQAKSAPLGPSFMTPVPVPMKLSPSLSISLGGFEKGKAGNELGIGGGIGMGMIGIGVETTKSESSQSQSQSRSSLSKEPSSPPSPSRSLRSGSPSPLPTLGHGHGHGTVVKELGDDDTASSDGNDHDNAKEEDGRYPW
ncbi:hypothetical protein PC9H_000021 [Pleurotus ostreatus]|uniref:DUF6534 domain-containing protein n=1 Tax=Pleurotus ostreatus TaxID=5322 RepID=A0A8H7DWD4_PLEOS|nr:uncharacterized protein PC9H_000021 [Pleurotus ostreatus]KAF7439685.1 hypothetical protein PC9H_000021 [Pleurotus ostreatus]